MNRYRIQGVEDQDKDAAIIIPLKTLESNGFYPNEEAKENDNNA